MSLTFVLTSPLIKVAEVVSLQVPPRKRNDRFRPRFPHYGTAGKRRVDGSKVAASNRVQTTQFLFSGQPPSEGSVPSRLAPPSPGRSTHVFG
jgi:hypothetical protein